MQNGLCFVPAAYGEQAASRSGCGHRDREGEEGDAPGERRTQSPATPPSDLMNKYIYIHDVENVYPEAVARQE